MEWNDQGMPWARIGDRIVDRDGAVIAVFVHAQSHLAEETAAIALAAIHKSALPTSLLSPPPSPAAEREGEAPSDLKTAWAVRIGSYAHQECDHPNDRDHRFFDRGWNAALARPAAPRAEVTEGSPLDRIAHLSEALQEAVRALRADAILFARIAHIPIDEMNAARASADADCMARRAGRVLGNAPYQPWIGEPDGPSRQWREAALAARSTP